ncbi:hypothetical protein OROHE_023331 [Orobanche hederae]
MVDSDFRPKLGFEVWVRSTEGTRLVDDGGHAIFTLDDGGVWRGSMTSVFSFADSFLRCCAVQRTVRSASVGGGGDDGSWAKEFLEMPDVMSHLVDPELKHFRQEELRVIYEVVKLCLHPGSSMRTSMREVCSMLESGIDTSISVEFNASSLTWTEIVFSLLLAPKLRYLSSGRKVYFIFTWFLPIFIATIEAENHFFFRTCTRSN